MPRKKYKTFLLFLITLGYFPVFWFLYLDEPSLLWRILKALGYGVMADVGMFCLIGFLEWLKED